MWVFECKYDSYWIFSDKSQLNSFLGVEGNTCGIAYHTKDNKIKERKERMRLNFKALSKIDFSDKFKLEIFIEIFSFQQPIRENFYIFLLFP